MHSTHAPCRHFRDLGIDVIKIYCLSDKPVKRRWIKAINCCFLALRKQILGTVIDTSALVETVPELIPLL